MVNRDGNMGQWGDAPIPLAPMLEEDYPQVVNSTRIHWRGCSMKYEDKVFLENTAFIDKAFFEMFDFPLKWGNIDNFDSGTELLISERTNKSEFGFRPRTYLDIRRVAQFTLHHGTCLGKTKGLRASLIFKPKFRFQS